MVQKSENCVGWVKGNFRKTFKTIYSIIKQFKQKNPRSWTPEEVRKVEWSSKRIVQEVI